MAAPRSYFPAPGNRFLHQIDQGETLIFDLDESDVWNGAASVSQSPEKRRTVARAHRKATATGSVSIGRPASLPMNVPDWSKILKEEYLENRRRESDDDDYADDDDAVRIPPHEFLARQMARARIASFSVHEGAGRTLKGRDLSRVRNAVWQQIGFED